MITRKPHPGGDHDESSGAAAVAPKSGPTADLFLGGTVLQEGVVGEESHGRRVGAHLLAAQREAGPLNAVARSKDGYWRALGSATTVKAWDYSEALTSPTGAGHAPSSNQVAIRLRTAAGEKCGFDFAASPDGSGWTLARCTGSGENVEHKACAGCAGWGPECWSVWSAPFKGISKVEWAGMRADDRAGWCAAHGFELVDEGAGGRP